MEYSWCTYCGKERLAPSTVHISKTRCWVCNSQAFGLIDYRWVSDHQAKRISEERNIVIDWYAISLPQYDEDNDEGW